MCNIDVYYYCITHVHCVLIKKVAISNKQNGGDKKPKLMKQCFLSFANICCLVENYCPNKENDHMTKTNQ